MSGGQRLRGDKRVWSGFGGEEDGVCGREGRKKGREERDGEALGEAVHLLLQPFFPSGRNCRAVRRIRGYTSQRARTGGGKGTGRYRMVTRARVTRPVYAPGLPGSAESLRLRGAFGERTPVG